VSPIPINWAGFNQPTVLGYQEIMEEHVDEIVEQAEVTHPDSTPDEAPWSQGEGRREAA
jgi:hypothetical protein